MAFKWKCGNCKTNIILPYESSDKMSGYSTPVCSKCFKELTKEYDKDFGEISLVEDENGKLIKMYDDPDGMIFECINQEDNNNA